VSRYQKGKNQEGETDLDLLEQETVRDSEWQWHLLGYMQRRLKSDNTDCSKIDHTEYFTKSVETLAADI